MKVLDFNTIIHPRTADLRLTVGELALIRDALSSVGELHHDEIGLASLNAAHDIWELIEEINSYDSA